MTLREWKSDQELGLYYQSKNRDSAIIIYLEQALPIAKKLKSKI